MPTIGRSAKLYQERRQPYLRKTLRGPGPQINLADNAIHTIKLEAPLPDSTYLQPPGCAPALDAGKTQVWPHGDQYAP